MAQGNMKKKTQLPAGAKGRSNHKKTGVTKKGKRFVAPMKAKKVEANKLKQGLTRAINKHIEEELTAKAGSCELKSLQILKNIQSKKPAEKS